MVKKFKKFFKNVFNVRREREKARYLSLISGVIASIGLDKWDDQHCTINQLKGIE